MFISYAQNFEDVMLWRALGHVEGGFYIDIGAQDPITDSVSLAFYEKGWRGIHVEPTLHYATLLRENRPGDVVIQAAVGEEASVLPLYEIRGTGLSTLDPTIAAKHVERGFAIVENTTPVVPLAAILASSSDRDIHWLKIDVEGFELQVLRGWGDCRARPWIVVVESTMPMSQEASHGSWEPLLQERDYQFAYFDGLNRYYVSQAHPELSQAFLAPPNVFDAFAVNGTASTNLHRLIVDRHEKQISALQECHRQEATDAHASLEALRARNAADLSARLSLEQQTLTELERAHAEQEARLRHELTQAGQQLRTQAREHAERDRELSERVYVLQQEFAATFASLELDHRNRSEAWHRDHAAERAATETAQTERELRWVEQSRNCERLLREQLSEAKEDARRIADELDRLEKTWVWRLTHPLGGHTARAFRHQLPVSPSAPAHNARSSSPQQAPVTMNNTHTAQATATANELLSLDGTAFIESAYLTLLGRPADPTGLAGLIEQLSAGLDKKQIIIALATSDEGKESAKAASLPGLQQLIEQVRRDRPTLAMRILQRLLMALLRPLSNQIRATDAKLSELCQSTQERFDRLDAAVAALSERSTTASMPSSEARAALDRTSLHGRETYFKLKDMSAQKARLAIS